MAKLEVLQADVTKLEVDAIANAANTHLLHGGGVAGAIVRAGGPEIQRESDERAPIGLGEAVETTAGALPARWVIHAATMEPGGPTSAEITHPSTSASRPVARSFDSCTSTTPLVTTHVVHPDWRAAARPRPRRSLPRR